MGTLRTHTGPDLVEFRSAEQPGTLRDRSIDQMVVPTKAPIQIYCPVEEELETLVSLSCRCSINESDGLAQETYHEIRRA